MRKYIIYLDKSPVSQNLIRIILNGICYLQLSNHIDELDMAVNDGLPDTIIINSNSFDNDLWKLFEARNPQITNCKKLLLTDKTPEAHSGIAIVKTPVTTADLYRNLGEKPTVWAKNSQKQVNNTQFPQNRRLFERKPHIFDVFFCDEGGRHLVSTKGRDISLGGIFIEDIFKPAIGSLLFLAFRVDGIEHSVTCQVARHSFDGFGVRFLGISDRTTKAILNI